MTHSDEKTSIHDLPHLSYIVIEGMGTYVRHRFGWKNFYVHHEDLIAFEEVSKTLGEEYILLALPVTHEVDENGKVTEKSSHKENYEWLSEKEDYHD